MTTVAMHIPDGYLGPQTFIVLWLVMLPIWASSASVIVESTADMVTMT